MQIKSLQELKQLIALAKEEHLASLQIGDISFVFSDIRIMSQNALTPYGLEQQESKNASSEEPDPENPAYTPNSKSWVDVDQSADEEEELLMWSARSN